MVSNPGESVGNRYERLVGRRAVAHDANFGFNQMRVQPMHAMRALRTVVTLFVVMLGPVPCAAQNDSTADRDRSGVLRWARSSLSPLSTVEPGAPWSDLDPLLRMIGDASLVATSEAVHMGAEPLEFRNRLFQYLVEK